MAPRRNSAGARRSGTEWGIRGALALLAAVLGYVGVTQSLAIAVAHWDPAYAHALAPGDGSIAAMLAQVRFVEHQERARSSAPARLARSALRHDPTAVPAVTTLGFQAQLRGDTAGARRLFGYAETLSRRDLQTELWGIEEASGRGDIPGTLRHYDIALRTSKTAPDFLFPVLASAVAEPQVRAGLVRTLAQRPAWAALFIRFVADNAAAPDDVVDLYAGLRRAGVMPSAEAIAVVVNRQVEAGAFDKAWGLYASVHRGVDRRRSRDPRFTADLAFPSLLDWMPVNDNSIATSVQPGKRGGVFDFAVPPSVGGVLLHQTQLLPPGRYHLDGHSAGIEQAAGSLPYWSLSCKNGRELGRVVVPPSAQAHGSFAGLFDVPRDCPLQILSLVARSSDEIAGVTGQLDLARLAPVAIARP